MYLKYNILFLSLVFCSCSINSNQKTIFINSTAQKMELEDWCKESSFIDLNTNEENAFITDISKFCIIDSTKYILDKRTNTILVYDKNGNYINKFKRVGRGGDEYLSINDFAVGENYLYILTIPNKIFITDYNFTIKKICKLSSDYQRIVSFKDMLYLYNHYDREVSSYNTETNEISSVIKDKRNSEKIIMYPEPIFHKINEDTLHVTISGSDSFYSITDNVNKLFIWDYDNKEEHYKLIDNSDIDDVISSLKYSPPHILSVSNINNKLYIYYVFNLTFKLMVINEDLSVSQNIEITGTPYNNIPITIIENNMYGYTTIYSENLKDTDKLKLKDKNQDIGQLLFTYTLK